MIGEDLGGGEEIHEGSDNSPTLTGDVAFLQEQPEISQNPPELQKRMTVSYTHLTLPTKA